MDVDVDLERLDREALIREVRRLRAGIRAHRDSSGHDLCWHHPELWALLPERIEPTVAVPPWPKFIRGCPPAVLPAGTPQLKLLILDRLGPRRAKAS
jgi:hypothetical protein